MKGIQGELGEMNIKLHLDVKQVKHPPYQLNLQFKEKVNKEIDLMLVVGLISPVDKYDWINYGGIYIYTTFVGST